MSGRFRPGRLLRAGAQRIIVAMIVVAGVAVILFPAYAQSILRAVGDPLADLIAVPMARLADVDRGIRDWWTHGVVLRDVREQNRALRRTVRRLEGDVNRWRERALASERLSTLLDFQQRVPVRTLAAGVIGRPVSNWYQGVILNKGVTDGVRVEMGVMTPAGVVGRIVKAGRSTSVALLLIDPNVAIGGLVQHTRDEGMVQGSSQGLVRMKYLPPLSSVKQGDVVVTSGLTGGFPRGVMIGRVSSVEESDGDLFQVAAIETAVRFRLLDEVLIVLAPHPADAELALDPDGPVPAGRKPDS